MFAKSEIKPFYTTRDVAQLLNVSEDTVREFNKYCYRGFPKGFKVVNSWRWEREKIDCWVAKVQQEQQQQEKPKTTRLEDFAQDMYSLLDELSTKQNNAYDTLKIKGLLTLIDKKVRI